MSLLDTFAGHSSGYPVYPPNISGLQLWLDGADLSKLYQDVAGTTLVAATDDPLGNWKDKSGNNRHYTAAADDTTRLAVKLNQINGLPAVYSAGGAGAGTKRITNASVQTQHLIGTGGHTAFFVYKTESVSTLRGIFGNAGGLFDLFQLATSGNIRWQNQQASGPTTKNATFDPSGDGTNVTHIVSGYHSAVDATNGTLEIYRNGVASGSPATCGTVTASSQVISIPGLTATDKFTGVIGEIMIYNVALSAANHNLVGRYLAQKWGGTWSAVS